MTWWFVRALWLSVILTAGCLGAREVADDAGPTDALVDRAPVFDGQAFELDAAVDAAPGDGGVLGRAWPRTAAGLRAALGERGHWVAIWQLDEAEGRAVDDLGVTELAPRGDVAYHRPGAWPEDRAIGFDSGDDALVATPDPLDLARDRSLAALFAVAVEAAPVGNAIASKRDGDGVGAILLAVDPATGHLRAGLSDGVTAATVTLPIDHRGSGYHDVLVVVDRQAQVLRMFSDLGRAPSVSVAALDDLATDQAFTLGASGAGPAARHQLGFAALAAGDVAGLAVDGDDALRSLRLATDRPAPIVRPPPELPWSPPWPIRRDRRGRYTIDVDPRSLRVATTASVWIAPTGDDAAAGTAAAPKRSLAAALAAMTAPTTIHLAAGTYDADAGWYGVNPAHDVNLVAEGGRARLTAAEADLVWRPSRAGPGVFETDAPAPPYTVIDARFPGVDPWLVHQATIAAVAITPGSWTATGTLVTVRPRDGRPPDGQVQVMPAATLNATIDGADRTVYLEGLDLEGGYKALHVQRARRLVLVDTRLRFGAGEGLSALGVDEVLAFGVTAEANGWDGLAYSWTAHVLEVDCAGRDNGRDGSNLDNGSTVHTGGVVVRIGGDYRDNLGPNLADVQGAWSWNLGTVAAGNRATQASQRINFYIDGTMWLREVNARDQPGDATIDLVVAPGGRIHAHDVDRASVGGAGTIDDRAE